MESFEINSNKGRLVQIETMSGEIEKGYLIGLMPDDVIVLDKQDEGCFLHICEVELSNVKTFTACGEVVWHYIVGLVV